MPDKPYKNLTIPPEEVEAWLARLGVPPDASEWERFTAIAKACINAPPPPGGFGAKLKAERAARRKTKTNKPENP